MRKFSIIVLFISFLSSGFAVAGGTFTDITEKAGIKFTHQGFMYIGGIVAADFNGDGYTDIYITNGEGYPNQLYINNKDLTFTETAQTAGVADMNEGWGAVAGDIDNDGDLDIYLSNFRTEFDTFPSVNRLFLNDGNGIFTDVTEAAGVGDPGPSTSVAMADINNDGFLDIYVLNRSFLNVDNPNTLYLNNGDGTFTDITVASGTGDLGTGLAVGFFDYDNDRFMDIYVVNEFEKDVLYHNNRDGTFTNMRSVLNNDGQGAGMGVDFSDIDNDGDQDIYVANLWTDFLYVNNGNGTFSYDEEALALTDNTMAWGVGFFDYDNNGWEDVYVVNGAMMWPDLYDEVNIFYRNNGDGSFTDIASTFGIDDGGDGRASAIADFNNDGYMDIIMMNVIRGKLIGNPILYLNNNSGNDYITIRLKGTFSNRSGIGAKIKVKSGSIVQTKEVTAGASFASMNTLDIGFGLKNVDLIDKITVYWPSGNVQVLTGVFPNQIKTITEPDELNIVTSVEDEISVALYTLNQNYPNPFNPLTTIRYNLELNSKVLLKVYDVNGREVARLVDENISAGEHSVEWDASDMPSGLYIYQLKTDSFSETKKMLLLK
ncbi:MAG: VCBS repeat-containing protein [Candidatus Marinimicrobia bacterium]|nr:VCBS repeat-containing protein [Candidatus Neomarinimicrobiota bacterium]